MKSHLTEALWWGAESHTVSGYRLAQVDWNSLWKGKSLLPVEGAQGKYARSLASLNEVTKVKSMFI